MTTTMPRNALAIPILPKQSTKAIPIPAPGGIPNLPMKPLRRERGRPAEPRLLFSPLAWLKLQYLCHAGPTEVAAFGLSTAGDPLHLEDVLVVKQRASAVSVAFDDGAVADLFERMIDDGVEPARFGRIWLHTHPGSSVEPTGTDEATFARAFGACDWAVMAILGRTGRVSARLTFSAGPGGHLEIASAVDWFSWPRDVDRLAEELPDWERAYALVEREPRFDPETLDPNPLSGDPHDFFGW
jgi:hypothetical protein